MCMFRFFSAFFLVIACLGSASANTAKLTILGEHQLTRFEQEDLEQLMSDMLAWIAAHADYERVRELPPLQFASPRVVAEEECEHFCPVARFVDGTLMLSTALDVLHSPLEESLVLHELVHYYQGRAGRYLQSGSMSECERELARETEAYRLQEAYYRTHGGRFMPSVTPVLFCDAGVLKGQPKDD